MKNISKLVACASLSVLSVAAVAQVHLPSPGGGKHFKAKTFTNKPSFHYVDRHIGRSPIALTYFNLNYDSADAITNTVTTHYDNQGELMNTHYVYPADTVGANYNVINYITVAFDSLFDPYQLMDTSYAAIAAKNEYLVVDTIVVPIAQINYSGINDTLEISLTTVSGSPNTGYPMATVIKDTLIIGQQLGTGTDAGINLIKWGVGTALSNPRFSVTVTYIGSKLDSCWFIYGFAGFNGSCDGGTFTLANPTTWSPVDVSGSTPVDENSFLLYNEYASYGALPDITGAGLFYDCNGDGTYDAGDGGPYEENVYIWSLVHTAVNSTLNVNSIAASGFSVTQNYPNPFNKETQIAYSLSKSTDISFSVYDITGREIMANNYNTVSPGNHVINLNANSFSPGVYFYTFKVGGSTITKKMIITE